MPPGKLSTAEIAEAAGVTDRTISRWVKLGLLPAPKIFYGAKRGKQSFWPAHAREQAVWVRHQMNDGHTFDEIRRALINGDFQPTSAP